MSFPLDTVANAWRKNSPELLGAFNGGLPDFVFSTRVDACPDGIPVFCYHVVDAVRLDADLRHLRANGYRTCSGDELLAVMRGKLPLVPRTVMLSFDDGPVNFHDVAFPLLQRYEARAIAFVAPGLHRERAQEPGASHHRPMTWEELRSIHDSGLVDVECHTLESRYVADWPRPVPLAGVDQEIEAMRRGRPLPLADDLTAAKHELERRLPGKRVRHLAFPAYDGTTEAMAIAARCGYESCHWGVLPGRGVNVRGQSPYLVARISHEFLRRLPGRGRVSIPDLLRIRLETIRTSRRDARRRQPPLLRT